MSGESLFTARLLAAAMPEDQVSEFELALLALAGTIVVAVLGAAFSFMASRRDRRRALYAEAVKAATAWVELLYRVRRRAADDTRGLIERAHVMQEELLFHQAWIGSESRLLKTSYAHLVRTVKEQTEQPIRDAWTQPPRDVPGNAPPDDEHPDISKELDRFLKDVRSHLSLIPLRRVGLWWRNREDDP